MPCYPYVFHSKMSLTRKHPESFRRSLRTLGLHKLSNVFFQGARCKISQFFIFNTKSLCLACTVVIAITM